MLVVKNLPANAGDKETGLPSPGREDPLQEGTATLSSILAWRIPWTEELGGLQTMGVSKSWTRLQWLSMYTHLQACRQPFPAGWVKIIALGSVPPLGFPCMLPHLCKQTYPELASDGCAICFLLGLWLYTPLLVPFPPWKPSICTYVLVFVCVLTKRLCIICMCLNFLINIIEFYISFCFLPFSLITIFFRFIRVAMDIINLLSLHCCSLLCSVHPPRLPIQSPDDGDPGGLQIPGTTTNTAVKSWICPLGSCVTISLD